MDAFTGLGVRLPFPLSLLHAQADLDFCLTSNVGALGTTGLLLRSFQRSFAGVCVLRLHEGLLQAVEVWIWVYSVMVHGCSATPDHHHPFTSAVAVDNFAFFAFRHAAPLTATYPDTAQRENRDKFKWLKTVSAGSKCQTTPGSGSSLSTATVPPRQSRAEEAEGMKDAHLASLQLRDP